MRVPLVPACLQFHHLINSRMVTAILVGMQCEQSFAVFSFIHFSNFTSLESRQCPKAGVTSGHNWHHEFRKAKPRLFQLVKLLLLRLAGRIGYSHLIFHRQRLRVNLLAAREQHGGEREQQGGDERFHVISFYCHSRMTAVEVVVPVSPETQ